jgi:DNA-binding beta-propeller fold protein YncE
VSDESGGVETVLNAAGRRVATIALGGSAGNVQYDAGSRRILVDVQTRNELAVIDPRTNRVVRRLRLSGCVSDHSLLIDSPRRLAFVTCNGNSKLLTLNLRTLKVTEVFEVGDGPDVLALDRGAEHSRAC